MSLRIQPVGAIAIRELVTQLGWLESQIRLLIIDEVIRPCMWLRNRTNNYISFHEFDDGFLNRGIRHSKITHFDNAEDGGVAGDHWYYLRERKIVGPSQCEFVLASRDSDSPKMIKLDPCEHDLSWILLEQPITLDEVLEQGVFKVADLQKIIPLQGKSPGLAVSSSNSLTTPSTNVPVQSMGLSHEEVSRKGGESANRENADMKAQVFAWLDNHAARDQSVAELVEAICRLVHVRPSTAETWQRDWKRQKGWIKKS